MTRRLLGAGALLLALGLGSLPAAGEDKKDDKDWKPLFNGKDLTGWKLPADTNTQAFSEVMPVEKDGKVVAYEGKLKDGKQVPLWRVEDGILIGSGPASHLFSERGDYTNFRYRVEAMINDHGNSGQYFRTKFGGGFPQGYEAQINATHGDKIRTGSLYPSFGLSGNFQPVRSLPSNSGVHLSSDLVSFLSSPGAGRTAIPSASSTTVAPNSRRVMMISPRVSSG